MHGNYKSDSGFSGTKLNCLYSNVDCIMKFKVSLAYWRSKYLNNKRKTNKVSFWIKISKKFQVSSK